MDIVNRCLTLGEFRSYVNEYFFGSDPANKLVIHHTWKPTKEGWAGARTIARLRKYYEDKKWNAGPHLFIAEDGIWLFSSMCSDGIHSAGLNHCSIGIEVVGDYDNEKWSGQTKINAVGAIKILMQKLNLGEKDIYFHRDVSPKSCPGWAITKEWLFQELAFYDNPPDLGLPDDASSTLITPSADSTIVTDSGVIQIPDWAMEAVAFVNKYKLFKIMTAEDVRHAVRFHRFYRLIQEQNG